MEKLSNLQMQWQQTASLSGSGVVLQFSACLAFLVVLLWRFSRCGWPIIHLTWSTEAAHLIHIIGQAVTPEDPGHHSPTFSDDSSPFMCALQCFLHLFLQAVCLFGSGSAIVSPHYLNYNIYSRNRVQQMDNNWN